MPGPLGQTLKLCGSQLAAKPCQPSAQRHVAQMRPGQYSACTGVQHSFRQLPLRELCADAAAGMLWTMPCSPTPPDRGLWPCRQAVPGHHQ